MADIPSTSLVRRIKDLPAETSPSPLDVVALDGFATRKATLAAIVNAGRPLATEEEAEQGDSATKGMSPYLTAQAIEAKRPAGLFGLSLLLSATVSAARAMLELGGLATKATVNNGDWSGADLSIANGGTGASTAPAARDNLGLGSAAIADSSAFATAAQGGKSDTAVQPGALAAVATSGAYGDLSGRPTLGTAAAQAATAFATAVQGAKADNAAPIARAVPLGGTTGQVLAKESAADSAVVWKDIVAGADLATITFATAGTARASFSGWDAFNSVGLVFEGQRKTGINNNGVGTSFNLIRIVDDSVNQVDSPFGGSKVDGFSVLHYMNGTGGAKGGRHAISASLFHVNTPGLAGPATGLVDDNYVGLAGQIVGNVNDGGTSSKKKGTACGAHLFASLGNGATHWFSATACEFNTLLGNAGVTNHQVLQIAAAHNARGTAVDTMIGMSRLSEGFVTFRHGILVGPQNGLHPLGNDSTFLKVADTTIDTAFDFSGVGFLGDFIRTPFIQMKQNLFALKQANAKVQLGAPGVSSTPALEFFGGSGTAACARLYSNGGTAADNGDLVVAAGALRTPSVVPLADNVSGLGQSALRFAIVYSAGGVSTTSDEREKKDISDLTADKARLLFDAVEAKTYRKVDDRNSRKTETITSLRPRTVRKSRIQVVEDVELIDGQAILRREEKKVLFDEPVFYEYPVIDSATGEQIIDVVPARTIQSVDPETGEKFSQDMQEVRTPRVHRVPAMEEYTQEIVVNEEHHKVNSRTHFGFLAQDFERALEAADMTTKDFAGVVIGDDGRYGLRYEQTIPILWSVVKALRAEVDALTSGAEAA